MILSQIHIREIMVWTIPVTLSDLQKEGMKRLQESPASILADPPGAGKTWTTLAAIASDPIAPTRILIVAPMQVLVQWYDEVEKISKQNLMEDKKTRSIKLIYPKSQAEFNKTSFVCEKGQSMALFLSPSMMLRLSKTLRKFKLSHLLLDEVHLYSRPRTKGWSALRTIAQKVTGRVLFLTANPIQNSYKELEALYRIVHKESGGEKDTNPLMPIPMVRRRPDTTYLPEREDIIRVLKMEDEEKDDFMKMESDVAEMLPIVAMIRAQMFGLRSEDSQKTRAVVNDCVRLKKEGKRTLIVLHRRKHFEVLASALKKQGLTVDIWSGAVKQKDRTEKLRSWQWAKEHSETVKELIQNTKLGSIAMPNFADMIADYWKVPDVLLLQSRAGGVGLNLQMFQAVLLPSLDWNPCSEDQAVARVVRRGQTTKSIPVIRYILEKSIDEKIMEKQDRKRKLANSYLSM